MIVPSATEEGWVFVMDGDDFDNIHYFRKSEIESGKIEWKEIRIDE